jgi:hypothetical protein
MESQLPVEELPRNRQAEAIHKHETFWQIYLPMILGFFIATGVCALSAFAASGGGSAVSGLWANLSLMFLIIQLMIILIPPFIIFGTLIYLIQLILHRSPPYFKMAQDFMAQVSAQTKTISNFIAEPMLAVKAATNALEQILKMQMGRGDEHGRRN